MLCVGSFAIVLALGGGPSAATFEVAVFEAIRFEFDPPKAAVLAPRWPALNLTCLALAQGAIGDAAIGSGWRTREQDWGRRRLPARLIDGALDRRRRPAAGEPCCRHDSPTASADSANPRWTVAVARATLTSIGLAVPGGLADPAARAADGAGRSGGALRQARKGGDPARRAHPADTRCRRWPSASAAS
jgi:thiamine transport system permease protein